MRILLGPLLGGLSHHRANIWARADAPAQMHVWLAAGDDVSEAKYLGAADLLPENGHAGVFPLSKLKPETRYYYAVSLKKKLPPKKEFHAFTTFPKPGAKKPSNSCSVRAAAPPTKRAARPSRNCAAASKRTNCVSASSSAIKSTPTP